MTTQIGDFMAWLGGADKTVLAQVPSERARFTQMAGVLVTTAGIAAASMSFALHDGVAVPWPVAIIVAFFWGVIILNLDRFLVLSIGSIRDRGRLLAMAAPRFALALVLATVISTPIVLRIFQSDISNQVYLIQLKRSAQQRALENDSKEQHQAGQLARQIAVDNAVLSGHIPSVTSPQLQSLRTQIAGLQPQVNKAQTAANVAFEAYECELEGAGKNCRNASSNQGNGPLANAKHVEYLQALSTLNSLKAQLKTAMAQEQSAEKGLRITQGQVLATDKVRAKAALPGLIQRYNSLERLINQTSANGTTLNQKDKGILTQLQALFELSASQPALGFAHLFVFLLFFMIEILPVGIKVMLNLAPVSAYDTVAGLESDKIVDRANAERVKARRIEEGKSQREIDLEDDMRIREGQLGKQANAHVASEMGKILDIALQNWSEQVQDRLNSAAGSVNSTGRRRLNIVQANSAYSLPDDDL